MKYTSMNHAQLQAEYDAVAAQYEALRAKGLKLDMSRGKPCREQLDMAEPLLSILKTSADCMEEGTDLRNYGMADGIPSCKRLFAEILGVKDTEIFVGGNSSLALMYGVISRAYTNGLAEGFTPWAKLDHVKFLCPAPGYDRHFKLTESFGAELITVPMTENGPDMDVVEREIQDPAVKGIWCVPKFSNPTGVVYSDETIRRLASLRPAASDFILMWDNAYCLHELEGEHRPFAEIVSLCRECGNPNMVYEFLSTSKITVPGAGVSVIASSEENIRHLARLWSFQTIGYDKLNQLRHVRYLKNKENTIALMKRHAAIIKPKFDVVLDFFEKEILPLDVAHWSHPKGGYFISLDTMPGCAKRTVALMKEAGIVLTGAGATYPYGVDPQDANIRIAPTVPPVKELEQAVAALGICLRLASLEKLLAA